MFAKAFRLHRHLFYFTGVYLVVTVGLAVYLGASWDEFARVLKVFGPLSATSFFFPGLILLFLLISAVLKTRPDRYWLLNVLGNFEKEMADYFLSGRFHNALAAFLALIPVSIFFCIGKSMIPLINDYDLDPVLADVDKWIHGGRYPHEYLLPFVKKNDLGHFFDDVYLTWFIVVYLVTEFCNWADPDPVRRLRFIWTNCLSWVVIGNVAAVAMASVGPIYYDSFYRGLSPYRDLTASLHALDSKEEPMRLFDVSEALLEMVEDKHVVNINAISAMPSLHVAIAGAMVFYGMSINLFLGAILCFYCLLMMMGSVYLGWHYAVDGYVGILMAWLLWRFSGWLVRKLNSADFPGHYSGKNVH